MSRKQRLEDYHNTLKAHEHLLAPFKEDMTAYFETLLEEDVQRRKAKGEPEGYNRRPTMGIQVQTDEGCCLVVRPGWQPPTDVTVMVTRQSDMEQALAESWVARSPNTRRIVGPHPNLPNHVLRQWDSEESIGEKNHDGKILPETITLELRGPNKLLELTLSDAAVKWTGGMIPVPRPGQPTEFEKRLRSVVKVCHGILTKPWETFKRSAALDNKCCCCHKQLDVDESRRLGIGPECIKKFGWFEQPSETAKKYRQQYRGIDDPWEIPND
jgi:hypothetical protein